MADISTFIGRSVFGDMVMTWGTYTDAGGGAGGDINTRINRVYFVQIQPSAVAATAATNQGVINETLPTTTTAPIAGSAIGIVCDASQTGKWMAVGDTFA
jgi:hypothetical protein